MSNIEKFDEIAEKLLAYLEATFPIPADVGMASLRLKTSKSPTIDPVTELETEPGEPLTEDEKYFGPTVSWLIESGFISALNGKSTGYYAMVLTEKGLALRGVRASSLIQK